MFLLASMVSVAPGSAQADAIQMLPPLENDGSGAICSSNEGNKILTWDGQTAISCAKHITINTNGFVGIGTETPIEPLDIINTTGSAGGISIRSFGFSSQFIGLRANGTLYSPTQITGASIMAQWNGMGYDGGAYRSVAAVTLVSDGAVYSNSAPGHLRFHTTGSGSTVPTERMRIDSSGSVGIGTATPKAKLHINGYVTYKPGCVTYYGASSYGSSFCNTAIDVSLLASNRVVASEFDATSDERRKTSIVPIRSDEAAKFIERVQPVTFRWKDGPDSGKKYGFVAQQILKAGFPDLVTPSPKPGLAATTDADGFVSPAGMQFNLSYESIIPLLAVAIKDLQAENKQLLARVEALESKRDARIPAAGK